MASPLTLNRDRLLYRAQFILGPRPVQVIPSSREISIANNVWLVVHSDLNTSQVVSGNKSLTLLGYILDPENVTASDSEIITALLPQLCSADPHTNSPQCTDRFGGRWILIANDGEQIRLFSDALGQRQICYTAPAVAGEVWCASDPGMLARLLHMEPDSAALEFVQAQLQAGRNEYWWPYDTSLYREIKFLNPNHYLLYAGAAPRRFWPSGKLTHLPIRRVVKDGARLIRELLAAAANRYALQIMMTAGWDSRLVLAASKEVSGNFSYLTFLRPGFTPETADVSVPRRLLQNLGKTLDILPLPEKMDEEFREIYMQNVAAAHEEWGLIAQALYQPGPQKKLRVSSTGSETVRQQLRPEEAGLTPEILTHYASAEGRPFAVAAFARWLADIPRDLPVGILDLFYWEQKCGNWMAVGQTEWDITGISNFSPYNCRALLAMLLSVNVEYCLPPLYELHTALIKELWPETLREPINPHKQLHREKPSVKSVAKHFLVRTHLLDYIPKSAIAFTKKFTP